MAKDQSISTEIVIDDSEILLAVLGPSDANVKLLEQLLAVGIGVRGNTIRFSGPKTKVTLGERALTELIETARRKVLVDNKEVRRVVELLQGNESYSVADLAKSTITVSGPKGKIAPKGIAQQEYLKAIKAHDIVFGVGPAGTGKTYLAMAMAVSALLEKKYKRIILTRPAVEAGEKLGFLPGDLTEKVNPYLRPLYDALYDMVDSEKAAELIQRGVIEVAPLAFMRGRTLTSAFVILDEAQNTTSDQMKMFLTRLGQDSKMVVTGDVTQIDLPSNQKSGLGHALKLFRNTEGISINVFSDIDVVRHPLVRRVIRAYENDAEDRR